ncbi:hypothetical protein MMC09_001086 [Bachmanniomyces sp. S44760]|nr:hypothetical protein [Bachmanniomyces sp. S44760]
MAEKTKWLSVAIIPLLLSLFLGHSYVTIPSLECGALYLALGRTVAFPNSDGYTSSLRSYYALQSQQHAPSCIIRPQDNRQVSVAVTVLTYAARTMNAMGLRRPIFSIRGGGHSTSMTSVNNDGIVIDLSRMKTIQINDEQTVTSIGPGAKWVDVYLKLDAMGLAVPGGRVADVGVAGLTTGGGISYFSPRKGFVCDNVVNFEVVLASGIIVDANATSNSDLFFALKGGSNNFGVVTLIQLKTFPQGKLWGGDIIYPISTRSEQFSVLEDFTADLEYDEYSSLISSYAYVGDSASWIIVNNLIYTKPIDHPPETFRPFTDIEPQIHSTLRLSNLSDFTIELGGKSGAHDRVIYTAITIPNEAELFNDVFTFMNDSLQHLLHRQMPGLVFAMSHQALPSSITHRSKETGGNVLGLDSTSKPQVLLNLAILWADEKDDLAVDSVARAIFAKIDVRLKQRQSERGGDGGGEDGRKPWIYLNYAAPWQDVITSYGEGNVQKLRKTSKKYDPNGIFQHNVPKGFKLFR